MFTVIMRPERFPQANVERARALEKYLTVPSTQARIRSFRYPGLDHALWWPSARDNSPAFLGYGGGTGPQSPPTISAGGILNAGDRRGTISRGTIVEIYGVNRRA